MANPFFKFTALVFALSMMGGCLKQPVKVSQQKSGDSAGCDLQATARESSEASQENFKCAYEAIFLAGKFSTGETFRELTGFIGAINDLFQAMNALENLFNAYDGYVAGGVDGQSSLDDMQTIHDSALSGSDKLFNQRVYKCFARHSKAFSSFLPLYKLSMANSGSEVSASDITEFAAIVPNVAIGLTQMTAGLMECAVALEGSPKAVDEKLLSSIKNLLKSLTAAKIVGECGLAIGRGGYLIGKNSMCLADDVKNYFDSRQNLDRQRDNSVNNLPVPQDNSTYTDRGCMQKYGIFLQKQSFWTFSSRAAVCSNYCQERSGSGYFIEHYSEIFPRNDDRQTCGTDLGSLTSTAGVQSCITLCCDQNNSCVESALSKND